MDGLKRLSGATKVAQDDFEKGVGTYIVSFDAMPKIKVADVKKELGKYKVDMVGLKITTVAAGNTVGDMALAGDLVKEVESLKGKKVVLTGTLTEDDKGKQTLTLSKVEEAKEAK
jgi:hypothetical protein